MKVNRVYIAIILLILILGNLSCSGSKGQRVIKVEKGPFHMIIHANGQLKSSVSTRIGPPFVRRMWRYTISFMIPEGKEVNAGTPILGFDTKELKEKWQIKSSELETAKKELERSRLVEQEKSDTLSLQLAETKVKSGKAQQQAQQPEDLVALNEVKKLQMDLELAQLQEKLTDSRIKNQKSGMQTRINALESKIKRLNNEVNLLKTDIGRLRINAPKAGIIVYKANWRGRKKAVGDTCWVGEKILELPDLTQMEVAAVIPEPQAGKVKEGQAVEFRLDSNPDKVYKGTVKKLGRIFRTKSHDQPAIVFDATIAVLNSNPEHMRPGMAASVDIIIDSKEDTLQIPEQAIVYHEKGLFVMKKTFTGSKRVPITIGARSGEGGSTIYYDNGKYIVDPDGDGPSPELSFSNPDFNYKSLRGTVVFRWEYHPGSTLYFVWTQNRADYSNPGDFSFGRDFGNLLKASGDNIFMLKLTHRFKL
jgi:multidrug efflux pump subunit AcrA (membrane-fusion protein)